MKAKITPLNIFMRFFHQKDMIYTKNTSESVKIQFENQMEKCSALKIQRALFMAKVELQKRRVKIFI